MLLEVKQLTVTYGAVAAVRDVSFSVDTGDVVVLIGPNGAGKSTVLRAISGLIPPASGTVAFRGQEIQHLPGYRRVRLGIAQVPEGRRLFPRMTVLENLTSGAYWRRDAEISKDIEEILSWLPVLKARSAQLAGTLSGGEQQMLAIGRALMARPVLLLLDEPSLGLAPRIVQEIARIIAEVRARSVTVVLVEQNARMALRLANRGYVLETGSITLSGTSEMLRGSEHVRKAYLGA